MSTRTSSVPSKLSSLLTLGASLGLLVSLSACSDDDGGGRFGDTMGDTLGTSSGTATNTTTTTGETDTENDTDEPMPSGFGQAIEGGTTASGFSTITLTIGGAEYKVKTNPWGGAAQTITAGGGSVFTVDFIEHPDGGNPWDVASYPAVYKGMAYGGEPTADSGMPIAVGDIAAVYTGMQSNALSMAYQGNATYDVYFTNAADYTGGPPDVYLMVWFDGKGLNPINTPGEGWTCGSNPPTFVESCSSAGSATIEGKTFHRFVGPNGNATVISYVPDTTMGVWEFDLNGFIQDAVSQGILTPQMYLQSVQAGFELADAGTGLTIQDFYIDVF